MVHVIRYFVPAGGQCGYRSAGVRPACQSGAAPPRPALPAELQAKKAIWPASCEARPTLVEARVMQGRWPDDLPAFCARIVEQFAAGRTLADRSGG
jgi:hypothetical protein